MRPSSHFRRKAAAALTASFSLLAACLPVSANTPDKPVGQRPASSPDAAGGAWLGVLTKPLPKLVGEHLGLEPGHGLSVEMVVPDSPAAKAGLQKDDVIVKLGDQSLVLPDQLAILVDARKPGESRPIEILRDGKPMTLDVTLAARPPEYARRGPIGGNPAGNRLGAAAPGNLNPGGIIDLQGLLAPGGGGLDIARIEENIQKMQREFEEQAKRMAEELELGAAEGQVDMQVFRLDQGKIQIGDDQGSITIEKKDGVMNLTAKDKEGNVVWEGPYATEEDKAKVPEEIRQRAGRFKFQDGGAMLDGIQGGGMAIPAPDKEKGGIEGNVQPGERVD